MSDRVDLDQLADLADCIHPSDLIDAAVAELSELRRITDGGEWEKQGVVAVRDGSFVERWNGETVQVVKGDMFGDSSLAGEHPDFLVAAHRFAGPWLPVVDTDD